MKAKTLAFSLLLLSTPAVAQVSAPVYVSFRFAAATAVGSYGSEADLRRAEDGISAQLAALCRARFEWWNFKAATTDTHRPRLNVVLKEAVDWQILVTFVDRNGVTIDRPWEGRLFTAQDFELLATRLQAEGWGPTIAMQFEREILDVRRPELLGVLQKYAPLAYAVKLPDGPSLAPVVLPLRWDDYKSLSGSLFTIVCRSQTGSIVTLHTLGTGMAASFNASQPAFDGLGAELSKWEVDDQLVPISDRLTSLPELRPLAVFLKEYRTAWAIAATEGP